MAQSDYWNKLKKRLREVSTAAADFTEEQALIGKLKFDILTLTRKIDRKQREIGVRICELSKETRRVQPFNDGDIIRLLAEIEELNKQVDVKRGEINKVADQVRMKREEQAPPTADVYPSDTATRKPKAKSTTPTSTTEAKPKRRYTKRATKATGTTQKTTITRRKTGTAAKSGGRTGRPKKKEGGGEKKASK